MSRFITQGVGDAHNLPRFHTSNNLSGKVEAHLVDETEVVLSEKELKEIKGSSALKNKYKIFTKKPKKDTPRQSKS
ncbi:MAG: hypothetical protein LBL08_03430 [Candidatus Nomurabacteria bacterium]|jgi:predicted nucleic acid-binding OB-fold protein|nr:hypothetical protein [Candidatus Nomurabacteria bacterium]